MKFTPSKEKLTVILREFEPNHELADAIEKASKEMRQCARSTSMPILDTSWSIRFGKKPEALTKIEALEATGSPLKTTTVDTLELENADLNAARNIAARAAINWPIAFRSPTRGERWKHKP